MTRTVTLADTLSATGGAGVKPIGASQRKADAADRPGGSDASTSFSDVLDQVSPLSDPRGPGDGRDLGEDEGHDDDGSVSGDAHAHHPHGERDRSAAIDDAASLAQSPVAPGTVPGGGLAISGLAAEGTTTPDGALATVTSDIRPDPSTGAIDPVPLPPSTPASPGGKPPVPEAGPTTGPTTSLISPESVASSASGTTGAEAPTLLSRPQESLRRSVPPTTPPSSPRSVPAATSTASPAADRTAANTRSDPSERERRDAPSIGTAAGSPPSVGSPRTAGPVYPIIAKPLVAPPTGSPYASSDERAPSGFLASNTALTAVLSGARRGGDGTYQVNAVLNPPSLGRVDAVIKVDGTAVTVSIVAHSIEGHHTLAAHLEELGHELGTTEGGVQLSLADHRRDRDHRERADDPDRHPDGSDPEPRTVLTVDPEQTGRSLHVIL